MKRQRVPRAKASCSVTECEAAVRERRHRVPTVVACLLAHPDGFEGCRGTGGPRRRIRAATCRHWPDGTPRSRPPGRILAPSGSMQKRSPCNRYGYAVNVGRRPRLTDAERIAAASGLVAQSRICASTAPVRRAVVTHSGIPQALLAEQWRSCSSQRQISTQKSTPLQARASERRRSECGRRGCTVSISVFWHPAAVAAPHFVVGVLHAWAFCGSRRRSLHALGIAQ